MYEIKYVMILIFGAWHYMLRCGYISDDHAVIEARTDIIPDAEKNPKKESYWLKVFNDGIVMYYLNAVLFKWFRKVPFAWHLLCVVLHMINSYLLIIFLTPYIGYNCALVAVFLWAVNPMQNQVAGWISGRPYSIAMILSLVALIWWREPYIFIPLYGLAVITNISIAFLPVILKLLESGWQVNMYLIMMVVIGAPFILWKFHKRFTGALVLDRENFKWNNRKVFNVVRVYGYYIWTILCPVRMGWYHQGGFRYNDKWSKVNIYTVLSVAALAIMTRSVWGWWFVLGMAMNVNVFATNSYLQDRYTYFGSIGLWILIAPYLVANPEWIYILGSYYVTRTYMYTRTLINDEAMYRENWRMHPKSDYAVNNLSFFLIQQKRFDEARVIILRGLDVNQENKMLWYNLGVTFAAQGNVNNDSGKFQFFRAIDCWKKALALEPRWAKPAQDLKLLVNFLIERKVISVDKQAGGMSIDIPAIRGINIK